MTEAADAKRLYVGNLSWGINDASLAEAFSRFGTVTKAEVAIDRMTGRSRGFAFVNFETEEQAQAAIAGLDGQDLDGRPLRVNVAQPREEGARRPAYSGGSRGGFGGGAPRRDRWN